MMIEYEGMQIEVDRWLDGQYFARIYEQSPPDPLYCTALYLSDEQAVEAAKEEIETHRAMTGGYDARSTVRF